MNTPLNDGPALARAAADALRRRDARAARDPFDIARPELTDEENRWVATLFEGIDAFTGQQPAWDI
jgi:hypothetical protein